MTPRDAPHAAEISADVRKAELHAERPRLALQVYADLAVFIDQAPGAAAARKRRLDDLDRAEFGTDCAVFAGTPGEQAGLLLEWRQAAGLGGFRLRPGALPHDLAQITLRDHLGLGAARPAASWAAARSRKGPADA